MDIYSKKNDTSSGKKKEKPETQELKVNVVKKLSQKERRIYKKKQREKTAERIRKNNLEGKYGEVWVWSGIDPESKYIFPDATGTRKRKTGKKLMEAIEMMRKDSNKDLLIQTDNYDAYETIVKQVYARETESYRRSREGEILPKKVKMPENINYTVLCKQRNSQGEIEEVSAKIVFGDEQKILKILKDHNPTQGLNTAYIERTNLNRRHFNARLRRKTIAYSKAYDCLVAQLNLQRIYYNFCWAHHTLKKIKGHKVSPAMYIGVTDKILNFKNIFAYPLLGKSRT